MRVRFYVLSAAVLICFSWYGYAADSPQFRGPNRDGVFLDTGLMQAWPSEGPPLEWVTQGLGTGYASASIAGERIYVPGAVDGNQGCLFILDSSGTILSTIPYGQETEDSQAPGPRSTPTIDGDRAYLVSGLGVLTCFDLAGTKVAWQVDMLQRFGGQNITWTIAESPLVDGQNVICTPGGPDAAVAALNKVTGETVWTSKGLSDLSAYCSPDVIEHGGRRIVVTMTAKYVVGVEAGNGLLLWTHPHETEYDIHGVTPVFANGMLYYTAGYKSGGGMLELAADGASITPRWTDKTLDCQHHGVVLLDGYIYGTSHGSGAGLVCLELSSGEVMWSSNEITQGATVCADGMLYIYEGPKRGVVSLVKASPAGFEKAGMVSVNEGTGKHWAHPSIAGGRLYIRRGDALIAYSIAAK